MTDRLEIWARLAIWALPVYGVLLAVSTITQQPDYQNDFPAYARYITTPQFLLSHVIASIAGAGFGLVGATALFILTDRMASRQAPWGFGLWAFAQAGLVSIFGVAAFFQPAIGRAFLDGSREVAVAINEDVYGEPLFLMAGLSVLLFIAGGILLGIAARRARLGPRWAGYAFAASVALFAIGNFVGIPLLQSVAGLGVAGAGVRFAVAARSSTAGDADLGSPQEAVLDRER
jgi:hypothetical protein